MRKRLAAYRNYRALGMFRRTAFTSAFVPLRVRVANAVLHGRPVAYRLNVRGGFEMLREQDSGALIAECQFRRP